MSLSQEQIDEFKRIYKERFGIELTNQEAYEKGMQLLRLMRIIYRPIKKDGVNQAK